MHSQYQITPNMHVLKLFAPQGPVLGKQIHPLEEILKNDTKPNCVHRPSTQDALNIYARAPSKCTSNSLVFVWVCGAGTVKCAHALVILSALEIYQNGHTMSVNELSRRLLSVLNRSQLSHSHASSSTLHWCKSNLRNQIEAQFTLPQPKEHKHPMKYILIKMCQSQLIKERLRGDW